MKINFDTLASKYNFPITKKEVVELLKTLPDEVIGRINLIRFGCNTKTTQEGRLVKKGNRYEIRINFFLNGAKSRLFSDAKYYRKQIENYGGIIDNKTRQITWSPHNARYYSMFLLLHEIGHIIYNEKHFNERMVFKSSREEEAWCDNYAEHFLKNYLAC